MRCALAHEQMEVDRLSDLLLVLEKAVVIPQNKDHETNAHAATR